LIAAIKELNALIALTLEKKPQYSLKKESWAGPGCSLGTLEKG
jgi:hypothetical protein